VLRFVVDPMDNSRLPQVIAELDGDGNVVAGYVYGDDLIRMRRDGQNAYYHYDGNHSTRFLTDAAGAVTDTYAYDAFGNLVAGSGSTVNYYLFSGQQYDPNLGFYYLRARYYQPSSGRFLSMDPYMGNIYDPISLHKYLYAHNNPVNLHDPTGLFAMTLGGLSATVSISQMISFHMPTVFKGGLLIIGITTIWRPAFQMRNSALDKMASGALGPMGWDAAMKQYQAAHQLIQLGAGWMTLSAQMVDIAFIGLGFKDMAKAVLFAPRLTVHTVQVSRFVQTYTRIEYDGQRLLIEASRLSITEVRTMHAVFTDWSKAIFEGTQLFFNILHEIQGQTG
jgi:RHS repeat-associated protein